MTKGYARFLTAFFCLFLGGILVWHLLLPDRERSETENRTLARRPELTWSALADGSFTRAVEDYFADQFPLRDGRSCCWASGSSTACTSAATR